MAFSAVALADVAEWNHPFPPFRLADGLYYVGTAELAEYLVTTSGGAILINTGYESTVPVVKASVEKLGFRFSDIKILLISHSHNDHAAGCALVKRLTGAKLMVMSGDVAEMEDGGRSDFAYTDQRWPPVHVDRVLHDQDIVKLGATSLTAHLTPGHTKGCTTWTLDAVLNGRMRHVVIAGSATVNSSYKLKGNSKYPEIAADYRKTFAVLKSLPCDIFLGAHGSYFNLQTKYDKWRAGDTEAFDDPNGYRTWVLEREKEFEQALFR